MKNNALVIQSEDWEGLYINGYLVDEGHTLNEGIERVEYFVELSKQYEFDINELKFTSLKDDDVKELENIGNLPLDVRKLNIDSTLKITPCLCESRELKCPICGKSVFISKIQRNFACEDVNCKLGNGAKQMISDLSITLSKI